MKSISFLAIVILLLNHIYSQTTMNPALSELTNNLEQESNLISGERKEELNQLATEILRSYQENGFAKLTFVCTHNSRRSQLSEIWMRTAAQYYGIDSLFSFSGGTESTAFNHRMVAAVERAGFGVKKLDQWDNPKYLATTGSEDQNLNILFSKKYDDSYNPKSDFIAVMVCSQADEACPFVPGAFARISLPYEDPKAYDNTDREGAAYDAKVKEIGREILYLGKLIAEKKQD